MPRFTSRNMTCVVAYESAVSAFEDLEDDLSCVLDRTEAPDQDQDIENLAVA